MSIIRNRGQEAIVTTKTTTAPGHEVTWYIYRATGRVPYPARKLGWQHEGFDASCSCGWDTATNGGTWRAVDLLIRLHFEDPA